MEIKELLLEEIKPYENNPRKNDEAVDYVANSIKEFGWKQPIVVDKNHVIICGHTRYKAACKLKLMGAPVIVANDLTPKQVKALRLADNKTAEMSEWDFDLLNEEISNITGIDMKQFGFLDEVDLDIDFDEIERKDLSNKEFEKYEIIISLENENELEKAYNNLTEQGYKCQISTL